MNTFIGAQGPRAQTPTPLILPEEAPATLARSQSGEVVLTHEIDRFFLTCTARQCRFLYKPKFRFEARGRPGCTPTATGSTPDPKSGPTGGNEP